MFGRLWCSKTFCLLPANLENPETYQETMFPKQYFPTSKAELGHITFLTFWNAIWQVTALTCTVSQEWFGTLEATIKQTETIVLALKQ